MYQHPVRNVIFKQSLKTHLREVVSVILESDQWKDALRIEHEDADGVRVTPLRSLIRRFPDMAKLVFDRCIETNLHSNTKAIGEAKGVGSDDRSFAMTMDYELIDDAYCKFFEEQAEDEDADNVSFVSELEEVWDDNGRLLPSTKPYSSTTTILKHNHPLMIMVQEKRTVIKFYIVLVVS